uniref:Uncharacterized protein n=1 Tax=Kalanchoe fedtschenkoi TaxID=63787 RepID=A0A7N0UCD2_KALFE
MVANVRPAKHNHTPVPHYYKLSNNKLQCHPQFIHPQVAPPLDLSDSDFWPSGFVPQIFSMPQTDPVSKSQVLKTFLYWFVQLVMVT